MIPILDWHECYGQSWRDVLVPEAFSHPAKMARGLVRRIFGYLLAEGLVRAGDTVLDPFGGIGTTGIEAGVRGVRSVIVELEPKFVALAQANVEKHRRAWEATGKPIPVVLQGDSRRLRAVLREHGIIDAVVSSPPYVSGGTHPDQTGAWNSDIPRPNDPSRRRGQGGTKALAGYGREDGQLGQLREGDIAAVISSPPYGTGDDKGHPSLGSVNQD